MGKRARLFKSLDETPKWRAGLNPSSIETGVMQVNYKYYAGDKKDITFKEFLKASPAKTLLDYFSNHWDRIMGVHYETEAFEVLMTGKFNNFSEPEKTFKGGMDYLIFPLIARKLMMDVVKDIIDNNIKPRDERNFRPMVNSVKLLTWGILELLRHVIGMMVMTFVVLTSPLLLLADHDLVSKDYNKNIKERDNEKFYEVFDSGHSRQRDNKKNSEAFNSRQWYIM